MSARSTTPKPPKPAKPDRAPQGGGSPRGKNDLQLTLGIFAVSGGGLAYVWAEQNVLPWWEAVGGPWLDHWLPVILIAGIAVALVALVAVVRRHRAKAPTRKIQERVEKRHPERAAVGPPRIVVNKKTGDLVALAFMCDDGVHPGQSEADQLAGVHGVDTFGGPAVATISIDKTTGRDIITLTKSPDPEPAPPPRDPVEQALETIATQVLPQVTGVTIVDRDKDKKPTRVRLAHAPAYKALVDEGAADKIERALVSRLGWKPHTYRMVWDPETEVATLERWVDPLSKTIPALPYPETVDLTRLQVGVADTGEPFYMNLTGGRHVLAAGATGAGKSSGLHSIMRATAPATHAGWVQHRGVDPKGGAEFGLARAMFYDLAAGPVLSKGPAAEFRLPDGLDMLEIETQRQLQLLKRAGYDLLMRAYRLGAQGIRKHTPSVAEPAVFVWVDEIALITTYMGSKADRELAAMAMAAVVTQGRAWSFHMIAALQDPRMRTLEIRNLFPVKLGFRLDRSIEVGMVLGESAVTDGARAHQISKDTPGVLFVVEDGSHVPTRNRAAFVDDPDIVDMCTRYPAPEWEPPAPVGETDFESAVRAMVPPDTVRAVEKMLDSSAVELDKAARPKKPSTRKQAARTPKLTLAKPAGPELIGHAPPCQADEIVRGDWIRIVDDDGTTRHVQVTVEPEGEDPVVLAGDGWSREYDAFEPMLRVFVAD